MATSWTDTAQVGLLAGQLILLVVAAIVAGRQVGEARRLREEQNRPFVVIDFEVEQSLVFLSVSNLGTSLARNVRFAVTPPFATAMDSELQALKMFRDGISTLPPGKRLRTLFDSFVQRTEQGLPYLYEVEVRYTDERGRRAFSERLDLDIGVYRNLSYVVRHDTHDLHERLKEIRDELRRWRADTGRGLLVMSPDQNRAENERMMEAHRQRQAIRGVRDDHPQPEGEDQDR